MNTRKRFERHLRSAPQPAAPDGLLNRLKEDVAAAKVQVRRSAIRSWFAPAGSVSLRRIAAAAAIAIAVMLPLSYGAVKAIKCFTISGTRIVVKNSDNINNEEDARKALEEFGDLYRKGEATEIKPGVWKVTLSSGEEFAYAGRNPELVGLPDVNEKRPVE
jgi:hypothetical protein